MSRTRNFVARALSVSFVFCSSLSLALAQNSAFDQYRQSAISYNYLQAGIDLHKAMLRAGPTREDWCKLAEAYDGYSVSLKREIETRRYMTAAKFVDIKQADLDRFKVWQENVGAELRNAERRCR